MHEESLIARAQRFKQFSARVLLGIGDDAALLSPGEQTLVWTVDTLVENTHFLRSMPAAKIGWKTLAVSLSDLAAMNARPLAALLSLGLPSDLPAQWSESFFEGLSQACEAYQVDLAGGDTVRSSEIHLSLSLLGQSAEPLTRFGAQVGDLLVVSGSFGGSAAGLHCFKQGLDQPEFLERHWHPKPRFEQAAALAEHCERVALLDTSDGLARSIQLLCQANQLGCLVQGSDIPFQAGLDKLAADMDQMREWVLNGGEDYELLAAVPPEALHWLQSRADFKVIGKLLSDPRQTLVFANKVIDLAKGNWGYQHFGN